MSFHREPSRLLALIAILAIALIGCATDTSQGAPLEYRRSGGIVGFDDYLAIDTKGTAILTRRRGAYGEDGGHRHSTDTRACAGDAEWDR